MNKLEELERLKIEVQNLECGYTNKREYLLLKAGVIVDNFFGKNPKYKNLLLSINFHFTGFNSGASTVSKEEMWNTGKDKFIGLIDTLIYDLELSEGLRDKNLMTKSDTSKVFIVHGHNDGAKNEVARFVEKLGFEAIILHEQSSSGDTIIEKIIRYSDVGFGIVLYTECDVGGVKTDPQTLNPRARQNVIFEHGFLIGKIGRENVVALVKGNVEKPNDIAGVVYVDLDESSGWKLGLVKEMISSGYDVDMSKFL